MIEKLEFWKNPKHDNDEVDMKKMVTEPKIELQEKIKQFRKIKRQTYAAASMQAKRRNNTSQYINQSFSE